MPIESSVKILESTRVGDVNIALLEFREECEHPWLSYQTTYWLQVFSQNGGEEKIKLRTIYQGTSRTKFNTAVKALKLAEQARVNGATKGGGDAPIR